MSNPSERFTGLAEIYARRRPGYPPAAIDHIAAACRLDPNAVLVDIGCGTGISSRLFADKGMRVIGIEPNAEMITRAQEESPIDRFPLLQFRSGRAEATELADASCDIVLAAQAFHWFEPNAAFTEFQRILKPGGWVALMWNERDDRDAFTAAYSNVIRSAPEAISIESERASAGDALLDNPLFLHTSRINFANEQILDEHGVIGRALSASYAPKDPDSRSRFVDALRKVFSRFDEDGRVSLRYETSVFLGRKPSDAFEL